MESHEAQPLLPPSADIENAQPEKTARSWRAPWWAIFGHCTLPDTAACCLSAQVPCLAWGWNMQRGLGMRAWREAFRFFIVTFLTFAVIRGTMHAVVYTRCGAGAALSPPSHRHHHHGHQFYHHQPDHRLRAFVPEGPSKADGPARPMMTLPEPAPLLPGVLRGHVTHASLALVSEPVYDADLSDLELVEARDGVADTDVGQAMMLTQVTSLTTTSILSVAPHEEAEAQIYQQQQEEEGMLLHEEIVSARPQRPCPHRAAALGTEGAVAAAAAAAGSGSEGAAIDQAMASLHTAAAAAAAAAAASNNPAATATTAATLTIDDLYADDYGYVQYVDAAEEAVGEHQEYYDEDLQESGGVAAALAQPLQDSTGGAVGAAVLRAGLQPSEQVVLQRLVASAAARGAVVDTDNNKNIIIVEDVYHEPVADVVEEPEDDVMSRALRNGAMYDDYEVDELLYEEGDEDVYADDLDVSGFSGRSGAVAGSDATVHGRVGGGGGATTAAGFAAAWLQGAVSGDDMEPLPGRFVRCGDDMGGDEGADDDEAWQACSAALGHVPCALAALLVVASLYAAHYTAVRRAALRERFGIPGSFLQDFALWLFCPTAALAQETRTLMHNNVEEGLWLGPSRISSVPSFADHVGVVAGAKQQLPPHPAACVVLLHAPGPQKLAEDSKPPPV